METRDQAGGYLHAEYPDDEEPVYVRMSDHLNVLLKDHPELIARGPNGKPAKYFRVRRALYGCQKSCKLFYRMFRDFMVGEPEKLDKSGYHGAGWKQSEIGPCVFYRRHLKGFAVLCCHVDDSLMRSDPLTIKTLFWRLSVIWLCHHLHPIAKTDFAGDGGGYRFLS